MVSVAAHRDHQAKRGSVEQLIDWRSLLVLLLIFVPLERLIPNRREQPILRRHWANDVVFLLVNGLVIRLLFVGLLALVLGPLERAVPAGITGFVAAQPIALQVVAAIIIGDLGFYLHHRLFHAVPFLWRFHAVHHSIEELDWLAAHRVHPLDQLVSTSFMMLPILLLGFGAPAIAITGFVYFLQSHLIHSNTRLSLGRLEWLVAAPRFHHWHHANEAAAFDHNFGGQLLIWDRVFGTLYLPDAMPRRYGVDLDVPALYPRQLAFPFVRSAAR